MSQLSDRADRFAAKLRPPVKPDTRGPDEKLAAFTQKWTSTAFLRKARRQKDGA